MSFAEKLAASQRDRANRQTAIELLQYCLGQCHPGQDVQIVFRTTKHRELSGYWTWSLTELVHVQRSTVAMRSELKGKDWTEYHKTIAHRRWRWANIERLAQRLRDGTAKEKKPSRSL